MMKRKRLSSSVLFFVLVNTFVTPISVNAEWYKASADYKIERKDYSLYYENGNLKVSQYFDKVVLQDSSANSAKINELLRKENEVFLSQISDSQDFIDDYVINKSYDELYLNYEQAEVTCNKDNILSIKMTSVWYMGGVCTVKILMV